MTSVRVRVSVVISVRVREYNICESGSECRDFCEDINVVHL